MNKIVKIGEHYFHFFYENTSVVDYLPISLEFPHKSDMSIQVVQSYGQPFINYDVTCVEDEDKISFSRADYYIEVSKNFREASIYVYDEFAFKHAMMNLYSSFIVHREWGLLIHSSCVVDNDQAHLFTGHSGAGKSTAAKLSAPRTLLSDEASILKISPDGVTIYNSPFRSELKVNGHEKVAPLVSIQLLKQSLTNQRTLLKPTDGWLEMMDKVFYWVHDKEEASKVMKMLHQLVQVVPVYHLYFQKNNTFWELMTSEEVYSKK